MISTRNRSAVYGLRLFPFVVQAYCLAVELFAARVLLQGLGAFGGDAPDALVLDQPTGFYGVDGGEADDLLEAAPAGRVVAGFVRSQFDLGREGCQGFCGFHAVGPGLQDAEQLAYQMAGPGLGYFRHASPASVVCFSLLAP